MSFALCLFLALVLELPNFVVYMTGLAPMFAAAAAFGSGNQDKGNRLR